jgi:hypothetical protein
MYSKNNMLSLNGYVTHCNDVPLLFLLVDSLLREENLFISMIFWRGRERKP